jgi:hypothetical protein
LSWTQEQKCQQQDQFILDQNAEDQENHPENRAKKDIQEAEKPTDAEK